MSSQEQYAMPNLTACVGYNICAHRTYKRCINAAHKYCTYFAKSVSIEYKKCSILGGDLSVTLRIIPPIPNVTIWYTIFKNNTMIVNGSTNTMNVAESSKYFRKEVNDLKMLVCVNDCKCQMNSLNCTVTPASHFDYKPIISSIVVILMLFGAITFGFQLWKLRRKIKEEEKSRNSVDENDVISPRQIPIYMTIPDLQHTYDTIYGAKICYIENSNTS